MKPGMPAQLGQLAVEQGMHRMQVAHVVGRVFALQIAERSPQPVRTRLALGQRDAGDLFHQLLVARGPAPRPISAAARTGVEQWRRQGGAATLQGLQSSLALCINPQ